MDPKYYKNTNPENRDNLRREKISRAQKKIRLLMIIAALLIILLLIVIFAAIRAGGLSNLTKGDQNPIQNTIKNIGTTFVGDIETPTQTPTPTANNVDKPLQLTVPRENSNKDFTKSNEVNFIVLNKLGDSIDITIKPDTYVYFRNISGDKVILEFSDNKSVRLGNDQEGSVYFTKIGTYTFKNAIDVTPLQIKGIIRVEN